MTKRNRLFTLAAICLILGGCAAKTTTTGTTPAAPTPPQVTVLQYAQVAQAAGDTAARVLVALCTTTPPTVNLTTCNQAKTGLLTVKGAVDQIVAEANKVPGSETWAVARVNIAAIGATATVNAATGNTALDQDIAAVAAAVKLIMGVQ
jgi:PBP1b-binding outer membrane lipoprotein LpoB